MLNIDKIYCKIKLATEMKEVEMSTLEKILELQNELEENKKKIRQAQKDEVKNMLNGKVLRLKAIIRKNKQSLKKGIKIIGDNMVNGAVEAIKLPITAGRAIYNTALKIDRKITDTAIKGAGYAMGTIARGYNKGIENVQKAHEAIKVGVDNAKKFARTSYRHHKAKRIMFNRAVKRDLKLIGQGMVTGAKAVARFPLDVAKGSLTVARNAGKFYVHCAGYALGATVKGVKKGIDTAKKTHQAIKIGVDNAKKFIRDGAQNAVKGGENLAKSMVRGVAKGGKAIANTFRKIGKEIKNDPLIRNVKSNAAEIKNTYNKAFVKAYTGR